MTDTAVATNTKSKTKPPSLFKVVLLNDDYTPMEFVVEILIQIFGKTEEEASAIMLHVHNQGRGVAGIYTFEIANQKQNETHMAARKYNYPLKTKLEESAV